MKKISAVLGLALLMGCGNNPGSDCPRRDKGCGKNVTSKETLPPEQREIAQEDISTLEEIAPSN